MLAHIYSLHCRAQLYTHTIARTQYTRTQRSAILRAEGRYRARPVNKPYARLLLLLSVCVVPLSPGLKGRFFEIEGIRSHLLFLTHTHTHWWLIFASSAHRYERTRTPSLRVLSTQSRTAKSSRSNAHKVSFVFKAAVSRRSVRIDTVEQARSCLWMTVYIVCNFTYTLHHFLSTFYRTKGAIECVLVCV